MVPMVTRTCTLTVVSKFHSHLDFVSGCMLLQIPEELHKEASHIVAFKPLIDNRRVMHHMIVFGCSDDTQESVSGS